MRKYDNILICMFRRIRDGSIKEKQAFVFCAAAFFFCLFVFFELKVGKKKEAAVRLMGYLQRCCSLYFTSKLHFHFKTTSRNGTQACYCTFLLYLPFIQICNILRV